MKICNTKQKTNNVNRLLATLVVSTLLLGAITQNAHAVTREQAKRIHDRLIGVPPTEADLDAMEALNARDAALYAMDWTQNSRAKSFYNVVLKNWITPWTNEAQTKFAPLNDYTATVIGIIRDNKDFREVLTGDYVYIGLTSGLPSYSNTNNNHYETLESNAVDLSLAANFDDVPQASLGMPGSPNDSAGVLTTRAAGMAFFDAGTNRLMVRATLMNYMCRDLEEFKDTTRVPDRIRQDVSRSPGGDSSLFLNQCIGCHAGMDALAGAFAYYEWSEATSRVIYTANNVQQKYHINSTTFEHGFRTRNDSWLNYWRQGPNAYLFAADENAAVVTSGNGANTFGVEIANSPAFASCQVKKVYKQVCMQNPISEHQANIDTITTSFMSSYNLKEVFADVAELCMGN